MEATSQPGPRLHTVHAAGSPLHSVLVQVERIAAGASDAIFYGESGTGKETLARRLHAAGRAPETRFVSVGCAGRTDADFERELAPYLTSPGAGTLFLDDVGELSISSQSVLVRVLDRHPAERPRVIAASVRELVHDLAAGRFRRDLFDALACAVHLPPLRERREDVLAVFDACWTALGERRVVREEGRRVIRAFGWPGNVRELAAFARRLSAASAAPAIGPLEVEHQILAAAVPTASWIGAPVDEPDASRGDEELDLATPPAEGRVDLPAKLREVEGKYISWALRRTGGNRAAAAALLGLRRTTLVEKLRRLKRDRLLPST